MCIFLRVPIRGFTATDGQGGAVEHRKVDPLRTVVILIAPYVMPAFSGACFRFTPVSAVDLAAGWRWLLPAGAAGNCWFCRSVADVGFSEMFDIIFSAKNPICSVWGKFWRSC